MTLAALRDGGKLALAAALVDLERDGDSTGALALLDEAWRSSKAHVVGITGPPGVGKSSLVRGTGPSLAPGRQERRRDRGRSFLESKRRRPAR